MSNKHVVPLGVAICFSLHNRSKHVDKWVIDNGYADAIEENMVSYEKTGFFKDWSYMRNRAIEYDDYKDRRGNG